MSAITRDSLLPRDAYARIRVATRAQALAHRRLRAVALGPQLWLQFEDEQTVRRQIQDVLHAGKVDDEARVQAEIDACSPLLPDRANWKASLLVSLPQAGGGDRRAQRAALAGVEHRVHLDIAGQRRIHAVADEDLGAPVAAGRPLAVHFLRFALDADQRAAALAPSAAVAVGCDHPGATALVWLPAATVASLAADLR